MSVKLETNTPPNFIHVSKMQDGQIAEIVRWNFDPPNNIGRIVMRNDDRLVTIGRGFGASYNGIFSGTMPDTNIVRLLLPGEKIVIQSN